MALSVKIKNATAERLARQIAWETDETLTDTVIHALEDRLARLRADAEREIDRVCRELRRGGPADPGRDSRL